jgi:hypothetical protein
VHNSHPYCVDESLIAWEHMIACDELPVFIARDPAGKHGMNRSTITSHLRERG